MKPSSTIIRDRLFHLRPVFRSRYAMAASLLEVAPWVDVVMLFILMLITATATLKKPGLMVDLPVAAATSGARYDAHVLTVPREDVFFFADQRVGRMVLEDRLREVAAREPGAELIIEADRTIAHGVVTELYNLAAAAGWSRIVLATRAGSSPVTNR